HVRACMLGAKSSGKSPAKIVLITGREEGTRLIDRQQKPSGKTDLSNLVYEDAVLGQFGADRLQKRDLRRELVEAAPHLGLALLHFPAARPPLLGREPF